MKIAVACGGTGGHIFPGLATAEVLRARGHQVTLWLSGRDVERLAAAGWDGAVVRIRAAGLPAGMAPLRAAAAVWRLLRAAGASWKAMRSDPPDALLAMGSYASIGPALAARRLGVPVVLHEANAVPGRAIAWLAPRTAAVGVAFDEARRALRAPRVERTGLPLRAALVRAAAQPAPRRERFTVLVMGGSQGARRLNRLASAALLRLQAAGAPLAVVHLAGAADAPALEAAYAAAGLPHAVHAFLQDMSAAYRAADLAISRAGASSCLELALFGVPALLVPLPAARRDHQTANARALERVGAADVRAERDLTEEWLADYVERRRRDAAGREAMRQALRGVAAPDAAERLAALVEEQMRRGKE